MTFRLIEITLVLLGLVRVEVSHAERRFALELDPMTTALGARNLLGYVEPELTPRWTFSAVVFQADFPDWVDHLMSYRNRHEGFDSRIRPSLGAGTDYFFSGTRTRLHVGLITFLWNYEVARHGAIARFSNIELLPRLGYRYAPWPDLGIYFDGFLGLQFELRATGSARLDGDDVRTTPILPFGTVHVGYRF